MWRRSRCDHLDCATGQTIAERPNRLGTSPVLCPLQHVQKAGNCTQRTFHLRSSHRKWKSPAEVCRRPVARLGTLENGAFSTRLPGCDGFEGARRCGRVVEGGEPVRASLELDRGERSGATGERNVPGFGSPPEAASLAPAEEPRSVGILKSGVVDGMAYTLYADGSIEAQLPQGTVRFGSIAELRSHIENNS